MPKKTSEYKEIISISQNITETLTENYMPYAMSIIVSRAIPEIDGFKPSHRKLLYMMYKMGLLTGPRRKSADVVGQTMQLNPHGEGAIYETLVRLTRGNDALLHPFIDSKGNFGKQYSRDMAYAASRYTEVKLEAICAEIFGDIDKNTVQFIDNYNGLMKEPVLLPTSFPNVLVMPNQGIAVGMASSICSFNLREICEAAIAVIKNKDAVISEIITAPDFSTGGEIIFKEDEMRAIYETGRGTFKIRARYRYDRKNSCVEVFEIPYTTTIEAIIDKIAALVKAGRLREVIDVRDETDLNGLKIAIDIRKSASPDAVMARLFALTPLTDAFSCNFNLLINGRPKTMGVREILAEWHAFRRACIINRTEFVLQKNREKLHLMDGLSKVLLDIDKAVKIIRETEAEKDVVRNLAEGFSIDNVQAEFIAEIKLRNLNREYILKRISERDSLVNEIAELSETLKDDKKIEKIIINELKEVIKKYAKPRKTGVVTDAPEAQPEEELVEDYAVKLFLTEHNYFKKISLVSLRSSGEQQLKDGDKIIQEIECTNRSELLFFSDRQNVYKMKTCDITDSKASSMGEYLNNMLSGCDDGEKIVYITPSNRYTGFMLFAFENGKMSKVTMEAYATKQNRKKLINAYSERSKLIFASWIAEDRDFFAIRQNDKCLLANTSLITPVSAKNSHGVQVFTLKKKSALTNVAIAEKVRCEDPEFYRVHSIPSTGHFIPDDGGPEMPSGADTAVFEQISLTAGKKEV